MKVKPSTLKLWQSVVANTELPSGDAAQTSAGPLPNSIQLRVASAEPGFGIQVQVAQSPPHHFRNPYRPIPKLDAVCIEPDIEFIAILAVATKSTWFTFW